MILLFINVEKPKRGKKNFCHLSAESKKQDVKKEKFSQRGGEEKRYWSKTD